LAKLWEFRRGGRGRRGLGGILAERKKEIADNKYPEQLLGRDQLVVDNWDYKYLCNSKKITSLYTVKPIPTTTAE
jgi:hypothetical protein